MLFLLASIVLRPNRFRGVEPERRLGGSRDLGLFLFRLLDFAVSALLTFCHRNPPLNEARGCEPGVPREGRVFRFCKQPLEVGENRRQMLDPLDCQRLRSKGRRRPCRARRLAPPRSYLTARRLSRRSSSSPISPSMRSQADGYQRLLQLPRHPPPPRTSLMISNNISAPMVALIIAAIMPEPRWMPS